jgi:hypothetical protein
MRAGTSIRALFVILSNISYLGHVYRNLGVCGQHILDDRRNEPGSMGRQPDAGLNPVPQVQAAMAHFERAINQNPLDPNLYHNLMQVGACGFPLSYD